MPRDLNRDRHSSPVHPCAVPSKPLLQHIVAATPRPWRQAAPQVRLNRQQNGITGSFNWSPAAARTTMKPCW